MKKLLVLLLLFVSCKEKMETAFNVDTRIDIQVMDSLRNNLLNPIFSNSYKKEEIRIYFMSNGEKKYIYEPLMDYPNHFFIYDDFNTGDFHIRIFPNDSQEENLPVTLIQWDTSDIDTITCHFRREGYIYCDYLWYNKRYIEAANSHNRHFTVVKEGIK